MRRHNPICVEVPQKIPVTVAERKLNLFNLLEFGGFCMKQQTQQQKILRSVHKLQDLRTNNVCFRLTN